VSGAIARALNVPQLGGFLVKQVVNDSVASRLGIKGGNRIGITEGQRMPGQRSRVQGDLDE
jgi:hypothetical protein